MSTCCLPRSGLQQRVGSTAAPCTADTIELSRVARLPVVEKYDDATFSRLKMNEETLQSERAWHRFMVETVVPERKKDLPDDFKGL